MKIDHIAARNLLVTAWQQVLPNREPTLAAYQCLQSVCWHESNYGQGWRGAMASSMNWGAVQCHAIQDSNGHCPPGCAPATDSHASGKKYGGCFKVYATPLEGCADVVHWFARYPAVIDMADTGDAGFFATWMHDKKYYEGFGNLQQAVGGYTDAILRAATLIASALGEPLIVSADDVATNVPLPEVE